MMSIAMNKRNQGMNTTMTHTPQELLNAGSGGSSSGGESISDVETPGVVIADEYEYVPKAKTAQHLTETSLEEKALLLPKDFVPGPFDVICSRVNAVKKHSGNRRYLHLLDMNVTDYDNAKNRLAKSQIVSNIVDAVRKCGKGGLGGFVRKNKGRWYKVTDAFAREKVGQALRDRLDTKYKSSTKAKNRRRLRRRKKELGTQSSTVCEPSQPDYDLTLHSALIPPTFPKSGGSEELSFDPLPMYEYPRPRASMVASIEQTFQLDLCDQQRLVSSYDKGGTIPTTPMQLGYRPESVTGSKSSTPKAFGDGLWEMEDNSRMERSPSP